MSEKLNILGVPIDSPQEEPASMIPDTSRVLMSDSLKGNVPELEGDAFDEMAASYIIVIIKHVFNGVDASAMTGTLQSLMHDEKTIELEVRCILDEALAVAVADARCDEENKVKIPGFELHIGEHDPICFENNEKGFTVAGARVFDIDYGRSMCTLILQLK